MLLYLFKQRLNMLVEIETDSEWNIILVYRIVWKQWTDIVFCVQTYFFISDIGAGSVNKIVAVEIAFGFLFDFISVFVFKFKNLFRLNIGSEITTQTYAETFVGAENGLVVFLGFFGKIEFEMRRHNQIHIAKTGIF